MNRFVRVALSALVLGATLNAATLLDPSVTSACSCAGPIDRFDGQEDAVLVGRVGGHVGGGRFAFEVERWFKGGVAPTVNVQSATVPLGGGASQTNTCGVELSVGEHLVMAAGWWEGELSPSACSPHATVESPEGQAMLAAAARIFGPGLAPGEPPPEADDVTLDLGLIAIGSILVLVVIVVLAVASAFARRERPATYRG